MLTVSGIVIISSPIEETRFSNITFFGFEAISRHPYKQKTLDKPNAGRVYHDISVAVFDSQLDEARELLQPKSAYHIRIGEIDTRKTEGGAIFAKIRTRLDWIQKLGQV